MQRLLHDCSRAQIYQRALDLRRTGKLYDPASTALNDVVRGSVDRFCAIAARLRRCRLVLDVGAGHGMLLALLHELRHECCAVDLTGHSGLYPHVSMARGIPFYVCNVEIEPLPFGEAAFDAVVCCQVLKHFTHSHLHAMLEMHRVLTPGGVIAIDVPNVASFRNCSRMLSGKYITYDYREHYLYAKPVLSRGHSFHPLRHNCEFTQHELRISAGSGPFSGNRGSLPEIAAASRRAGKAALDRHRHQGCQSVVAEVLDRVRKGIGCSRSEAGATSDRIHVMSISAIVITKNAEPTIRRCIESLRWTDEIVVVDSGSTDRTLDTCRELGAKVHQIADWPGYGPQKNRVLDRASGDWIMSLDADEWMTPELRAEVERVIAAPQGKAAFAISRRSSFCGRYMRHSGWWPDYVVRLFRRGSARFSDDYLHERLITEGATGRLKSPIMHEAITSLDQMIDKMNVYSTSSAAMLHHQGRRASLATALVHGSWAFFRTYVLRLGLLDGRQGFMLAVANAEGSYYRYLKLMLLAETAGQDPANRK